MKSEELKIQIISAGRKAVEQLAADRLKNAAATKKLAIFDAFDILNKIDAEQDRLDLSANTGIPKTKQGFAERRSK